MFDAALTRLSLTARGHDRVLRVARTIADLASADHIAVGASRRGPAVPGGGVAVVESRVLNQRTLPTKRSTIVVAVRTRRGVLRFSLPLLPVALVAICAVTLPLLVGLGARWSAHATISELGLRTPSCAWRTLPTAKPPASWPPRFPLCRRQWTKSARARRWIRPPNRRSAVCRERVRARAMGGAAMSAPLLSGAFPDQAFAVLRDLLAVMEKRLAQRPLRRRAPPGAGSGDAIDVATRGVDHVQLRQQD